MSAVTATILIDGTEMNPAYVLTEIDVINEINRIPYAQLVLADGDAAQRTFPLSSSPDFVPGKEIEIKLRYEGDPESEATVFKGVVTKHSLEADQTGSILTVELKDKAVKMTGVRKCALFTDQKDDEVIQKILEDNGLQAKKVASGTAQHPQLLQYYCSDWDFLRARAEANGWWIFVQNGEVSATNPDEIDTGTAQHQFAFGLKEIYRFQVEADLGGQPEQVESRGWDIASQQLTLPTSAATGPARPGDFDPAQLAQTLGTGTETLQSAVSLSSDELQAWADGRLRQKRSAIWRGSVTIPGKAAVYPLEVMEISGLGVHFDGNILLTGVRHRVNAAGWMTDLQFGLAEKDLLAPDDVMELPAAGLLPGIHGLQIGIVDAFEADPDQHYRVRIRIPAFGDDAGPVWARMASPDAGNNRGFFFQPETGDEVITGFFNGDPRQPVILGSLYSSGQAPAVEAGKINEDNFIKGLASREGVQIWFDDKNKALQLLTSANQQITLNETDKKVEIKDVNGNIISMTDSGITIKSAKNLVLEAAQNVEIKGQKVDVK